MAAEDSVLNCFPAFLKAREIVEHYSTPNMEIELRIASKLTRDDFERIANSFIKPNSETKDWVSTQDSHAKAFRKTTIDNKQVIIEKKLVAKQLFTTKSGVSLSISAKTEIQCAPSLLYGMHFDMTRKKLRKSFVYENLRFDLSLVWIDNADLPEFEVEVELLPVDAASSLLAADTLTSMLTAQLLDAGMQIVKMLDASSVMADLTPS